MSTGRAGGSTGHPDFVGRRRELGFLRAALAEARQGRGGLVMLVGEAGIGKTRTAEQLADAATADGFRVLWGRCSPEDGAFPYRPWVQALRGLAEETGAHDRQSPGGAGVRHGAEILPEVAERLPGAGTTDRTGRAALPGESARFQLFDATSAWLRRAARRHPLALVLEDLHWADRGSLRLLAFVGREISDAPILLVGTRREGEPGGEAIHQFLTTVRYRSLALGGLAPTDVERILASSAPGQASRALADAVHAQTDGNPFFVVEIARSLDLDGGAAAIPEAIRLPDSVRSALAERLERLSGATRRLLAVASVIGREFSPALLERIEENLSRRDVGAALEEACEAGVLEAVPAAGVGELRFRHALLHRAVYEDLTTREREDFHLQVARTLESAYEGSETPAASLARHWARASLDTGGEREEKLARYSRLAGGEALAAHAYDEAAEHLHRALKAMEDRPMDGEKARLLVDLARARAACSPRWNRQDAWNHLCRVLDFYLGEEDLPGAVSAVVQPSISPEGAIGVADRVGRILERAPDDSAEAGWLAARHAAAVYFETGDYVRAARGFDRALENARRREDGALELRTLAWSNSVDHFEGRWPEVVERGRRVIRLARASEDLHGETYARYRVSFALAFRGNARRARREARASLTRAERLGDQGLLGDALYVVAALALLAGRWKEADAEIARGLDASPRHMPLQHLAVLLALERGNGASAEEALKRLLEAGTHAGPYPLGPALRVLALAQAAERLGAGARRALVPPGPAPETPVAESLVAIGEALTALRTRDVREALSCLRRLEPLGGAITAPLLATDRLRGRLAARVGERAAAAEYFERALGFCRQAEYRPELGWTCLDFARFLLERGPAEPGGGAAARKDAERAAGLLDEARAISQALEMDPLSRRCAELRERHGFRLPPEAAELTARELEVLHLLATGGTNKEIAGALSISRHTVAVHVSRILRKTGARNRTEAARWALRAGAASVPPPDGTSGSGRTESSQGRDSAVGRRAGRAS